MSLSKKYAFVPILFLALLAAVALSPHVARSQSSGTPLTGYAWSDNIGWVSLNCSSDPSGCSGPAGAWGLQTGSNGTVSGYAWSANIGWVSANAADVAGCPSSPCTPIISNGAFTGWLKALSAAGNGWDGWISLAGSGYGPTLQGNSFGGYSWGSNVVGWVSWSFASTAYGQCTPTTVYSCPNSSTIASTTTSASCAVSTTDTTCVSPQFCSAGSSTCLSPAPTFNSSGNLTGHLELIPNLIAKGSIAQVYWSVSNVSSCTVIGTNGDHWSGLSGEEATKLIYSQTTYTLTCIGASAPNAVNESVSVGVAPVFEER